MISTLCTAWLLENTRASASVKWHPIPVMNMYREEMWQHRDAAWLFHVCGIESSAVLFLDEVLQMFHVGMPEFEYLACDVYENLDWIVF